MLDAEGNTVKAFQGLICLKNWEKFPEYAQGNVLDYIPFTYDQFVWNTLDQFDLSRNTIQWKDGIAWTQAMSRNVRDKTGLPLKDFPLIKKETCDPQVHPIILNDYTGGFYTPNPTALSNVTIGDGRKAYELTCTNHAAADLRVANAAASQPYCVAHIPLKRIQTIVHDIIPLIKIVSSL